MRNMLPSFRYYEHGLHCGDFIFGGTEIQARLLDRLTHSWSGMLPLTPERAPSEFPFSEVASTLAAFLCSREKNANRIVLADGRVYERYGERGRCVLWVLVTEGPMLDLLVDEAEKIRGVLWTNRHGTTVLVEGGWEDATPLTLWDDPLLPAPQPVRHHGTEYVPMRDGVRLATEVRLPRKEGRYPVVLMRTPYNRMVCEKTMLYMAERGYALVSQDVRGREDSEGDFVPFVFEMEDGRDTLDWLQQQPWCDGKVGMTGPSYLGKVQWQAAATGHPALKALISQVTAGGPFTDTPRPEGAFLSGFLAWMFMMSERRVNRAKMQRPDWGDLLKLRPLRDIPEKALGHKLPFWEEWMKHPNYDDFWRREDWTQYGSRIDVPALLISGWYDDDNMGTAAAWDIAVAHGRKKRKMVLGPWFHNYNTTRCIHGVPLGLDALRYDLDILALRWFEKYLKGIDNGIEETSAVEYYEIGANRWRESSSWPPPEAVPTPLYLHSAGGANGAKGDGTLSFEAPVAESEDVFFYDPENPVPHLIDPSENEMAVPENYKDVEARDDLLVYSSAPLTKPLRLAGDITAVLYASSDAPDTDWLVRLTDVDEQGNSIRLTDRIVRARYRDSWSDPKLLSPGEIVRYEFRLPRIAATLMKGHRLRVQVASSAGNLVFPNPNTGGDLFTETENRVACQRVFHAEGKASHLILPVMK